ncbi:DNA-directed RNA polymerase III subunit RPC5-like [Centruroides sculpturatus]|uniref:DNA-directed RNA polymerase III subunit RPC5-like n=1 Tax=Centruroides sculpturatus TaxID=218467 RepID=UPI000C6DCFDB|nr:DNA-directed RNA polymerase III subunit RPC5-like [Centruroides sculpturatus]
MEDDDPVVEEIDVYLSKSLADNLYLFQYPVRPSNMTYNDVEDIQARVKPKQQKVELELPLNVQSSNYDKGKGEQIALNVDGRHGGENSYFSSSFMDKQKLTSSKAVSSSAQYAIGLLRPGKELHLTPLHAIIQLRPSFTYLDQSDSRAKAELKESDVDDPSQDEEEEAHKVTVRFAGPDSDKARQARERSYNYIQQQLANEPWVNVKYHKCGSHESEEEMNKLLCTKTDFDASNLLTTSENYVNALLPETLRLAPTVITANQLSAMSDIKKSPLVDQIRTLVLNAKVIQFHRLLECVTPNSDVAAILRLLQQVAMLVQGCWVVKSDVIYPKDSISPLTGVNSELLCRARDYIMWRYTQENILKRKEIMSIVKLPLEDITEMLRHVAHWKASLGWQFAYSFDESFVSKYPEIVQRQQMLWDARYQQLTKILQLGAKDVKGTKLPNLKAERQRKTKVQTTLSSVTENCIVENSCVKMDVDVPSNVRMSPTANRKESVNENLLESTTNKNSLITNGPHHHVSHPNEHQSSLLNTELMSAVHGKLREKYCLTLTDLRNTKLEASSNNITNIPDKVLEDCIIAVGGQRLHNKWPQETNAESLFALTQFGDHLDKFRGALVQLFAKTAKIRITTLQKKLLDEVGETLSNADFKQIIQEYCVCKSGYYYLKGTMQTDS